MLGQSQPNEHVKAALEAVTGRQDWQGILDTLPLAAYVTDSTGLITYSNPACAQFAGRNPEAGRDRWCVTWRLATPTGDHLPHEACPLAEALNTGQPVRGKIAIALRPDGSRRAFEAYPTPLFDCEGNLTGAVNLLVDVTAKQADELTDQASRCRRLAKATHDPEALKILVAMAEGYEETAAALRKD
jgi:PAS domain S-box-containing protein